MPVILPIIAGASAIAGIVSQSKQQGLQQQGLSEQEQIANQEMANKQQIFNQLSSFFTPYLSSGSPFLANIQSANAGQSAQQGNNAAGQFREQMQPTGFGFGPSGTTAAGLAGIGQGQAQSTASNYLTNLLNNEQVKFQAAQGLNSAGQMGGASQNQPNVSTQLQPANTASSIGALGQIFKTLGTGSPTGTSAPSSTPSIPGTNVNNIDFGAAPVSGTIP
jgi:hypothetical protein